MKPPFSHGFPMVFPSLLVCLPPEVTITEVGSVAAPPGAPFRAAMGQGVPIPLGGKQKVEEKTTGSWRINGDLYIIYGN